MDQALLRRYEYNFWANRRVLESFETATGSVDRARILFAHLLNAERIWISRILGEMSGNPWQERSLKECRALLEENAIAYSAFLRSDASLDDQRVIEYRTTQGIAFQTALRDILEHVLLHGPYHRGQIATAIKLAGGNPAMTDYILYTRENEPHTAP